MTNSELLACVHKALGYPMEESWNPLENQEASDQLGILLRINVEWLIDTVSAFIIRKGHGVFMQSEHHDGTPKDAARALRWARIRVAVMKGQGVTEN